jgi:hypothetical protein
MSESFWSLASKFFEKAKEPSLGRVGGFFWVIWISRNDIVFPKSLSLSILQVMFRGAHWIRCWTILSKEEGRIILKEGCRWVEIVAMEIFHKSGWNALRLIGI